MIAIRRLCWSGLVLVVVIAVAAVWRQIATKPPVVARLHDGTELRLVGLDVGKTFEVWHRPTISERWQAFIHSQPQPQLTRIGETSYGQSVGRLFFTLHDPKSGADVVPKITDVDVLDENSGAHWAGRASSRSDQQSPGGPCEQVILEAYPRRAAQIRIRCNIGIEPVEMTIPNRLRFTAAPQWKAEPLPQTRRVGEREYTLKAVHIDPLPANLVAVLKTPGLHFGATFDLELRDHGVVSQGYGITPLFEDETGNLSYYLLPASESIWRLRATISPSNLWEYREDDVWSLGTVTVPKPGEYHEFSVPPKAAERGVVQIAMLGPGHYTCADGKFTAVEALSSGKQFEETAHIYADGHYVATLAPKAPVLMVIRTGEKELDLAVRLKDHERLVDLNGLGGSGWKHEPYAVSVSYFGLRSGNFDQFNGTVEVQMLNARSDTVEFTFPAPAPIPVTPPGSSH